MITFDKRQSVVKLDNGSISYWIYINREGYLETVYFGKTVKDFDISLIRVMDGAESNIFSIAENREIAYPDRYKEGIAPVELSVHGRRDKRDAPIIIRRENGSFVTDFIYVSHKIFDGAVQLDNLPCAHGDNCQTVEFLLKERSQEIYLKHRLTIFDDKDIIVKNFEIINKTGREAEIKRAMSMQLDLPRRNFTINHFCGRWAEERTRVENAVTDGVFEIYSNLGTSSAEENPFVFLKGENADYDHGEVIGFNLIYSGNFKFRLLSDWYKGTHITYGVNDEDFEWILGDGESFVSPQAVISYSYCGIDKMSRNFHLFVRENIITYARDKEYKPVLFNSWEGCLFDFTTESIISYIDDSVKLGAELFVLDDGWFGRRNDDTDGLGDWIVNKNKIDLHRVIKHCHSLGIKFGIWFEPEMVNYNSDLYKVHPEYALCDDGEDIHVMRHQFHLDFSNPEAVNEIYKQINAFLNEYKIDYIKWDYNRRVYEHSSPRLGEKRQGEVYHRITLGYYSLISRIAKDNPKIMIEGCAGGGSRFDLGTLYYCPQIWTSDESNPVRRSVINYNTSLGYPLSCMATHVNDCKLMNYEQKSLFALFGTYGLEMNPNLLTDEEKKTLFNTAELYRKYHKDVIENGTLYHLASPQTDNWYIMQCVNASKTRSLVLLMNLLHEKECFRYLKLKGLDSDKRYKNNIDDRVFYGDYYMDVGFNFSGVWRDEFDCKLLILEEVEAVY